jgi:AmpD protein
LQVKKNHYLAGAQLRSSPNCDDRPAREDISLLVIHGISLPAGQFQTGLVDALFTNTLPPQLDPGLEDLRDLKVSSHLFIDREGNATQYVGFDKRAWHAGASAWRGRSRCNDFAIGIELEGTDLLPYTDAQYQALLEVTLGLFDRYPRLSMDAVVGHGEIAPGRKTDPGSAFDWQRYLRALAIGLNR